MAALALAWSWGQGRRQIRRQVGGRRDGRRRELH